MKFYKNNYFLISLIALCAYACTSDDDDIIDDGFQTQEVTVEYLLDHDFLMYKSIVNSQDGSIDTTECRITVSFETGGVVSVDDPRSRSCDRGALTIGDAVDWRLGGDTLFITREYLSPNLPDTYDDFYRVESRKSGIFTMRYIPNTTRPIDPGNGLMHFFVAK